MYGDVSRGKILNETAASQSQDGGQEPIVIKKYANRRLYNTESSSYVTLDFLCQLVKEGKDFVVYDAKTGEDLTRSVLTQIIFEEEGKGQNLLPIQFLRQLIRFYGDSLETALPSYLEMSMEQFCRDQGRMREHMLGGVGGAAMMKPFEDMARQNMAMFEQAFKKFSSFTGQPGFAGDPGKPEGAAEQKKEESKQEESEIEELRSELESMKKKLDNIANK